MSSITRSVKNPIRAFKYCFEMVGEFINPEGTLLYFEGSVEGLPEPPERPGAEMHEMDLKDDDNFNTLFEIHSQGFDRNQSPEEFQEYMCNHPDYTNITTWGLFVDGEPIGTTTMSHYTRNPDIGAGRATAIIPERQGEGWGKYMWMYKEKKAVEVGLAFQNSEVQWGRMPSIISQFKRGFEPKYEPDYWNSSPNRPKPIRWRANRKLKKLYKSWKIEGDDWYEN